MTLRFFMVVIAFLAFASYAAPQAFADQPIDLIPPTSTFNPQVVTGCTNSANRTDCVDVSSITFSITCTDNESSGCTTEYRSNVGGSFPDTWTVANSGSTYSVSVNSSEVFQYRARDGAGNLEATKTFTIYNTFTRNVSGYVYRDVDSNGSINNSIDTPLTGVIVSISTGASTVTNSAGMYTFTKVPGGNHTVTATKPSGYKDMSPASQSVTVDHSNVTDRNFLVLTFKISGTIYMDVDNDNSYDSCGTPPNCDNAFGEAATVRSTYGSYTTTASSATFTLTNFLTGSNQITLDTPTGYKTTNATVASPYTIIIATGSIDVSGIALLVRGYTISGNVFIDANNNTRSDDAVDSWWNGAITIALSDGPTGRSNVTTVSSANNAAFAWVGLKAGSYKATLTVPNGYKATTGTCSPADCTGTAYGYPVVVGPDNSELSFGLTLFHNVSGSIYMDVLDNNCASGTSLFNEAASITINGPTSQTGSFTGTYSFSNVTYGSYTLSIAVPSGYRLATSMAGTFTVSGAATGKNVCISGYSIHGNVIEDFNRNGVLDSDPNYGTDDALEGATITLSAGYTSKAAVTSDNSLDYSYSFVGLKGGATAYVVSITLPAGYTLVTGGSSISRAIQGADQYIHFFATPQYTITGNLYLDNDESNTYNAGDTVFPEGASLQLVQAGSTVQTTTANGSGTYSFTSVLSGDYSVTVTTPSGYKAVIATTVVHPFRMNETTAPPAARTKSNVNFLVQGYRIEGEVVLDYNHNGVRDSDATYGTDSYLANITMSLSGGYSTRPNITTSGSGAYNYSFVGLKGGATAYVITISVPAGYALVTGGTSISRTVSPADAYAHFYLTPTYTITGTVYMDLDDSNTYNAGDTAFTEGATVNLSGTATATTTSSGSGTYSFASILSGSYSVTIPTPSGYKSVSAVTTTHPFTVSESTTTSRVKSNVNFIIKGWRIEGAVILDYNHDGVMNSDATYGTDTNFAGRTMSLSGGYSSRADVTTSGSGTYNFSFVGLKGGPNPYTITITVPGGYTLVTGGTSIDRTVQIADAYANFFVTPYYTISGNLYLDVDDSGTYNAGDTAFTESPTISLVRSGSTINTTTGSGTGTYTFINVLSGSYSVSIPVPSGYEYVIALNVTHPFIMSETTAPPAARSRTNIDFLIQGFRFEGDVFTDYDHSGTMESPDVYRGSVILALSNGPTAKANITTSGTGSYSYSFRGLKAGLYRVTATVPTNTQATLQSCNPADCRGTVYADRTVGAGSADSYANFGFTPLYTVTGNIYMDINNTSVYESGSDPVFAAPGYGETATINYSGTYGTGSTSTTSGSYTISGLLSGYTSNGTGYTFTLTTPTGYRTTLLVPPLVNPMNLNESSTPSGTQSNINFLVQGYTITGNVFYDYNHNAAVDDEDTAMSGATMRLSNGYVARADTTSDASGNYSFVGLKGGATTYSVEFINNTLFTANYPSAPSNPRNNIQVGLANGDPQYANFSITPVYFIQGNIWIDIDKNRLKGAENNYSTQSSSVRVTNTTTGTATTYSTNTGQFNTGSTLFSGVYRVEYTTLPSAYYMTYPQNGPPPFFLVTVGRNTTPDTTKGTSPDESWECSVGSHTMATCDSNGSIDNLNYGINDSYPTLQFACSSFRSDTGIDNRMPAAADYRCPNYTMTACFGNNTPGIAYSGSGTANFGQSPGGAASTEGWSVGGLTNPETFSEVNSGVIRTSYDWYMTSARQGGTPVVNLNNPAYCGAGGLANCVLDANLPNGIYHADGNLTLRSGSGTYTFLSNKNYIILVNGDLTIDTKVVTPVGSTVTFSAKRDIIVTTNVYNASLCPGENPPACALQGMFSADRNVTIQGNNDCTVGADNPICIAGSVVANAGQSGGGFANNRDLCAGDNVPVVLFESRPDFILNSPEFIKSPTYIWQEVAP